MTNNTDSEKLFLSVNAGKSVARHFCDAVWEYNIENKKTYVYFDTLARDKENQWWSIDELTEYFKNTTLAKADFEIWDTYFNDEFLTAFVKNQNNEEEFYLRFNTGENVLQWHRVVIENQDSDTLIISGKNIYQEMQERSFYRTSENIFDRMMHIDVATKRYISHYFDLNREPMGANNDYDSMIALFIKKYVIPDEVKSLTENMRLDNVIRILEKNDKYILYATIIDQNGKLFYKKFIFCYLDDKKSIITLVRMDISDVVREYYKQITHFKKENYRDALTGASNRKYYEEKIKGLSVSAGVAIIDLDDFKLCNDTYGHNGGDVALVTVVNIIKKHIEKTDTLIRFGGDEFLLILPGISSSAFEKCLNSIQKEIYAAEIEDYEFIRLSVSIGGVISNPENETVDEAVIRADKLMYQAKAQKNRVVTERSRKLALDAETDDITNELKQQILIVDDSEINREILSEALRGEFRILEAENGKECIDILDEYGTGISLVMLDILMPVADGFEVLAYMNKNHIIDDIPVIMISCADSEAYIRRAYGLGVVDYISRPFDSKIVYQRVTNTIKLYSKQRRIISLITKQTMEKEHINQIMIDILSQIVEFRNKESSHHVLRIKMLTKLLLERLIQKTDKYDLTWYDRAIISVASVLHDIGKIGISVDVLNKPDALTEKEYEIMHRHTVIGEEILKEITKYKDEPLVKTAIEICRWHHERYDGGGYPDGLTGDEIPISAQVVAVADAYDALTSKRSYKEAYSHERAIDMIKNGECGRFNPILIECLDDIRNEIKEDVLPENAKLNEDSVLRELK